jgi:AcrR family transcriptional regulator
MTSPADTLNPGPIEHDLIRAFLDLLDDKAYKDISVIQICDASAYSRRTFYRYFKNKDDLVALYIAILVQDYYSHIDLAKTLLTPQFCELYVNFWKSNADFFKKVLLTESIELRVNVITTVHKKIAPLIIEQIREAIGPVENLEFMVYFFLGGFYQVLDFWIQSQGAENLYAQIFESCSKMMNGGLLNLREQLNR